MKKFSIRFGKEIILPGEFRTLPGMLMNAARKFPGRGIIYVDSRGEEDFVSYPDLIRKARQYLRGMQKAGIKTGDYVIIEIDDPKEFFYTYWAALFGGIISAPVAQPTSYDPDSAGFQKMRKVYGVLQEPVVLVEDHKKEKYEKMRVDSYFKNLKVLSAKDLQSDELAEVYKPDPDETAFLQFSSGSTGTPKGVVLSHTGVIATLIAMCNAVSFDSSDVICTWLPHTHDMGLIGQHLVAIAKGMLKIKMTPPGFVRSPLMFLEKISKYKATSFCCPNFGLSWMIDKVPDDKLETLALSQMKILFNGAEPISVNVMNKFISKFAKAGFKPEVMYPVYGMAEASLCVAFPEFHSLPLVHTVSRHKMVNERTAYPVQPDNNDSDVVEIVDEGYPVEGIDIRIADEKGNVVEENILGEIQIRGISVTRGYYNNPEANKAAFIDGWFKTGDLGFMLNGRLVVNGRLKDIIFIRGQNYYAHDLEEIIHQIEEIPRGTVVVVGAFNSRLQQEEILAFIRNKGNREKFLPLRREILNLINRELGIELTHVLPVKAIPKTTSGKVQRYLLRKEYENGEFDTEINRIEEILKAARQEEEQVIQPATALETAIRKEWAKVLKLAEETIGTNKNFFQLGGNSIKGIQLIALLEDLVQYELDHDILISCKTIEEMARYLTDKKNTKQSAREELIQLSASGIKQQNRSTDLLHKIAVTGMALRLPFADNKEEFWENLVSRKKCITKVSEKRKKLAGVKDWNDWICELSDIDMFDNEFFGIPAEEVKVMDPQQRIMMEVAYACLEDAGIAVKLDQEMNIGVYSGISQNSYMELVRKVIREKGSTAIPQATMVGNMNNIIAAYISHMFNFTGPAISIDTACSSSGVSLSLAVNALRSGQIKGALVMSSNLMITPTTHLLSQKAGILSRNEHCLVFDKEADGTVLGEGVVVFYIEPLVHAIKEQKNIYGIIEGIGVNNDGYSLGIMAPNPKGQYEALVAAYKDAAANPADISYIEAHGTGTALGDPVEIQALDKLFREFQTKPCGIGSVKSNVGHLLPTAGAAGLAKTLLCLKYRKKVPTFLPENPQPLADLEKSSFYIVNEVEEWQPAGNKPLKAGVSSFGFGGTNVHIVLEEYNNPDTGSRSAEDEHIITFSAQSQKSLDMNIKETVDWLNKNRKANIKDVCFTRNNLRQHFRYRKAFVFKDTEDLLNSFNHNPGTTSECTGVYSRNKAPKTAFLFEDTCAQTKFSLDYNLYGKLKSFKAAFDECAVQIKALLGESADIRALCITNRPVLQKTNSEPAGKPGLDALLDFSVKYSLAMMWIAYGLKPCCVTGKGNGEITALVVSGKIPLETGLKLTYYRDQIINKGDKSGKERKEYFACAANMKIHEEQIPFISAYALHPEQGSDIRYWQDALNAVPGLPGIAAELKKLNCGLIVNIGLGDEFMNSMGGDYGLKGKAEFVKLSISEKNLDWREILESISRLYVSGCTPDWENIYPGADHRMVSLPAYCFDRKSFWLDVA